MRGPRPEITRHARSLRRVENDAEAGLWSELRNRRLSGYKFVRQLPIGPYFADFACREGMLVVEVDGSQHVESQSDHIRDDHMMSSGWSVLRFWNIDVLRDPEAVLETILAVLEGRLDHRVVAHDLRYLPARKDGERWS